MHILFTLQFCYTRTLDAYKIFYWSYFNSRTVYAKGTHAFMCPFTTQSYVIKLSWPRKVLAASDLGTFGLQVSRIVHCASKICIVIGIVDFAV